MVYNCLSFILLPTRVIIEFVFSIAREVKESFVSQISRANSPSRSRDNQRLLGKGPVSPGDPNMGNEGTVKKKLHIMDPLSLTLFGVAGSIRYVVGKHTRKGVVLSSVSLHEILWCVTIQMQSL